ncbi:hypothetical protein ACHAWT_006373 [Skeletonema menzelii]
MVRRLSIPPPSAVQLAAFLLLFCSISSSSGFAPSSSSSASQLLLRPSTKLNNIYDDWSTDLLSTASSPYTYDDLILPFCDEEAVEQCLEELMDSDYGQTMFGRHDMAANVGITGTFELISLEGPEATLSLIGKFWHRRETVLGKAAMYLNARIPELTSITVASKEDLQDFEEVTDEFTGEVLYVEDKRSPDFNGDRETMEYQGLDPDARGPFPPSVFGSGVKIIPT